MRAKRLGKALALGIIMPILLFVSVFLPGPVFFLAATPGTARFKIDVSSSNVNLMVNEAQNAKMIITKLSSEFKGVVRSYAEGLLENTTITSELPSGRLLFTSIWGKNVGLRSQTGGLKARRVEISKMGPKYKLTISNTLGGTTDPAPGSYVYLAGTVVRITAIPASGYIFDRWLLDNTTRTENPIDVLLDRDRVLYAVFEAILPSPPEAPSSLGAVFYGWLVKDATGTPSTAAERLASNLTPHDFLVAAFYTVEPRYTNLSHQVLTLMHSKGIKVFAYVYTNYGARPIWEVISELDDYLSKGVDGIFFDEVSNLQTCAHYSYYENLYNRVKTYGADKTVILNTGLSDKWTEEIIMNITDILCVEHQWTAEAGFGSVWAFKYPPSRFMGLSTNVLDASTAALLTKQAWGRGVGFHYSTSCYSELETWFENYVNILKKS